MLELFDAIERGSHSVVWSPALTFENNADPDSEVRSAVAGIETLSGEGMQFTPAAEQRILDLSSSGLSALDAAHLALAEGALCDVLLTCDDQFQRRASRIQSTVRVLNPLQLVEELGHG